MSDGTIQLPVEGSGPFTDSENFSRGGNTIKLPRVQSALGPPVYVAALTSAAAAGKNHAGLWNASGADIRVWLVAIAPWITATISGLKLTMVLYRTTARGTATAISKTPLDPNDAASSGSVFVDGTYTVQPTVTTTAPLAIAAVQNEETSDSWGVNLWSPDTMMGTPVVIPTGAGVVIQQGPTLAGAGSFSFAYYWSEV